ncbi:glycosyl hydrolase family 71-domain-containing protein [Mycena vulgaris]|nr:glycosyl hydrolase family 71-domain-containing protein [Mycena vulgaris]
MQISLFLSVITWAFALVPNVQCRAIFAHYMVGSVTEQHVKIDIDQAQAAGIQGFSLNIGDPSKSFVSDTLRYMFAYAPTVGFHLHISMDIWASGDATGGHPELFNKLLNQYMHAPGYFTFNNLPYVTTFSDGGLNHTTWATWRASVPAHYFCPNFDGTAGGMSGDDGWWFYWGDYLDCIFTWESAWPVRPGQSKGSASQGSIEVDLTLLKSARARGKTYNMPISSLQYKNAYSTSVYREGDLTLVKRLLNIVSLGPDLAPDFVTIITWNDGPEGHYVGNIWPEQNTDDDPARYVYAGTRWDHGAWRPLIKAFAGAYMSGTIGMLPTGNTGVEGAMWYSGVMKSSVCPSGSYVDNWEAGGDQVNFAISSSTSLSNLEVRITSGGHVAVYKGIGPGTNYAAAPKYPGQQLLEVFSGGTRIAVAQGGRCVSSQCPDRIYNMNPIVVGIHNPNSAPAPVLCEDPVCANPNVSPPSIQVRNASADPSSLHPKVVTDHITPTHPIACLPRAPV